MIAAEVLDAMLAAGCTAEQIVAAVKADAAIEERKLQEKRDKDAERQRQHRAKTKSVSRDVTVTSGDKCDPSPSPSLSPQTPQTHPHTHPDNNTRARKGRSKSKVPKPDGVSEQTWDDFLAHRKAKKAPLTATALAGIEREAAKAGWTLENAISETITRGWQAFKADWVNDKPAANDSGFLAHKMRQRQARDGP